MAQILITAGQALASTAAQAAATYAASQAATAAQNAILGPVTSSREGPRRSEVRIMGASEGAPIPVLYGRSRLAGQIVWITPFQESTRVTETSRGGKGITRSSSQEATEYLYSVSMAVALCEGPIDRIGRVWADGKPIALRDHTFRLYDGSEDQLPDPLIEAALGQEAPAYRGLAYLVLEDFALETFGGRVPQLTFEVERSLRSEDPEALENVTQAVTLIPGSGEAVYDTEAVFAELAEGVTRPANVHNNMGTTDVVASLDHLQDALPNTGAVELIVSWFGTDLRAGACRIEPGVEAAEKTLLPEAWSVAGDEREDAYVVSQRDGAPAYGGTPSDRGVEQTIRDLRRRGLATVFYPFILMDVPAGNGLPDPYGAAEQGAFPWRGRITCAAGTDGTADAREQVEAFFARYRRMVVHYAELCREAGGVDAFLVGSELRGLTRVRGEDGGFPGVRALTALCREVASILPDAKVSYAADWSEYAHYQPGPDQPDTGSLLYPLDDLWADDSVDFIGIDNYMPLSDWRGAGKHLDRAAGADSIYDLDYLRGNIRGGEGYDWYYASEADREAQVRTPIADTAHGEDWVFRTKDLWSWWSNPHTARPGGVKGAQTAWVPASKPIWFTELGCSAADKGSNQPNVFVDPKSSESFFPYHSNRERDDLIQRRFLEAHLSYWTDPANNPVSAGYGGPMVEPSRLFLYTWDARPFPDFPVRSDVWTDAENWTYGHWLNGRVGKVPLGALVEDLARRAGLYAVDASACTSLVTGYVIDRPMSARAALSPLFELYQLDAVERDGVLVVTPRTGEPAGAVAYDELVDPGDEPILSVTQALAGDLPGRLSLTYTDGLSDYDAGVAAAALPAAGGEGVTIASTAVVLEQGEAEGRAEAILAEAQASGVAARFALPPDALAYEPSDVLTVDGLAVRVTEVTDGPWREAEGTVTSPGLYAPRYTGLSGRAGAVTLVAGPVACEVMDLPLLPVSSAGGGQDGLFVHVAAFAEPWPGAVTVYAGQGTAPPLAGRVQAPALMGRLVADLPPGPTSRWDRASEVRLVLPAGTLSSLDPLAVLGGAGRAAVQSTDGSWEVLQYQTATLSEDGDWRLTDLLRGQRGTEAEAAAGAPAGARVVFLDGALAAPLPADALGTEAVWQAGPATKPPGAFPYREVPVRFFGASARPFAPAHLRAAQEGTELRLSWVRRTRIGGDAWGETTPLGETEERYRVRVIGAAGVLSSVEVTTTEAILPAAGATELRVAQWSSVVGWGREAILPV